MQIPRSYTSHKSLVITLLHALFSRAYKSHSFLYMIVNAAQDEKIYPILKASNSNYSCLFDEPKNLESPNDVAPYLLKVTPHDPFFLWCCNEGITKSWMFFFISKQQSLDLVSLHFKRHSLLNDPQKKQKNFRYYDARVLPAYLQTCNRHERATIFKHVDRFWIPQKDTNNVFNMTQFNRDGSTENLLSNIGHSKTIVV